jgi:hypothetical protein
MKFLGLLSLLIVFACGKSGNNSGSNSSNQNQDKYSCNDKSISCSQESDWNITSARVLPKNFSIHAIVMVDGYEYDEPVMSTCAGDQIDFLNLVPHRMTIHFKSRMRLPRNNTVRLDIKNMGEDCNGNEVFFAGFVPMVNWGSEGENRFSQSLDLQNIRPQ